MRRIKFRSTMPLTMEMKLVHKYGFAVYAREQGKWIIYEKKQHKVPPKPVDTSELTEGQKNFLIKELNAITDWYEHPEVFTKSIRQRIMGKAATKPPAERQFCIDWMDANVPEVVDAHANALL